MKTGIQTRAAANEVQPDDHEYLVEESWQPIEELVENVEADTNDELHAVNKLENGEECTEQDVKQIIYDTKLSTSSTCKTPETQQGANNSKVGQMTLGITEHLYSERSMAHVECRGQKENSPENIKANEDEFIKTKEINEKRKDDVQQGFGMEDRAEKQQITIGEIKEKDYPVDEFGRAEHEETSLEAHVNNDKTYNEQHDDREEFEAVDLYTANDPYSITLRIKPEKINNEAVENQTNQ